MSALIGLASRLCLLGAVVLAGLGALEKASNMLGSTFLRGYDPWRLIEFASVLLLFTIALELWGMRRALENGRPR